MLLSVRGPQVRFLADVDQPSLGIKHSVRSARMLGHKPG